MFLPCDFMIIVPCIVQYFMQIQRKMLSAEPGIAPHSARSSVRDLNMQSNHILKSQVT
jgi:hypothetical protein